MKIAVVSGGFDPIHSGHIALLKDAKDYVSGNNLVVGVNSDEWLIRKKGRRFLPIEERISILQSIRYVDYVWRFDDSDDSAINLLERVKLIWGAKAEIIFCNGGDRNQSNNREIGVSGVKFVYGIGGLNKLNSSSTILEEWENSKNISEFGQYGAL